MANTSPTLPLAASAVALRLVIQTNSNKHVNYLTTIAKDSILTLQRLEQFFGSAVMGAIQSNTQIMTNAVYATDAVTLASFVAADTVTVNGTVLTGATNPSGAAQFKIGVSDTATAVNLAACINANANLSGTVQASSALAVVTLYCVVPGKIGNLCTLAISAHGSVTGANFASGSDGTMGTVGHGL